MSIQTEHWDRIRELFEVVSRHPPEERLEALRKLCPNDANLQNEVLSLLQHDERAEPGFLTPTTTPSAESENESPDTLIGARLGKCMIRRVIAAGGMGVVYEAEQENPRRIVAIKVMKSLAWSRMAKRRFEFEVQSLARLTHPNIAQIHDADTIRVPGVAEGTPYFVMEFIPDASSITDYANRHKLDRKERLELFLQACDAVHYGHQRGIIHRDLKPANILVGGNGQAKVIDFGVARATDSDVAATTQLTDVGQLIGTLRYMSPEQCAADPLGLDVRSDVYALGVVLYELLCGRLPYDVSRPPCQGGPQRVGQLDAPTPSGTLYAMIKTICEQPPGRPSAADRSLRGDLEIILLKALEKDREKRYQSVADLARDIRHYINREPIEARRPSRAELIKIWIRRNPLTATTILAFCIGMLIVTTSLIIAVQSATRVQEVEREVEFRYLRPDSVELSDDTHEARLISVGRNILHTWQRETNEGSLVVSKELIEIGGPSSTRAALIGFPSRHPLPLFAGSFCAFDVDSGDFDVPIWCTRIDDNDVPKEVAPSKFKAIDFHPKHVLRYVDIFAEVPGMELVVTYGHGSSLRVLRILSVSDGRVLYQVWHDGSILSAYWLNARRLLVIAGENQEAEWPSRGGPKLQPRNIPWTIWAISPKLGLRASQCVNSGQPANNERIEPEWYKCIWPPVSTAVFCDVKLVAPLYPSQYDGSHFNVNLTYDGFGSDGHGNYVVAGWYVNASGENPVISDTTETNRYRQIEESNDPPKYFQPISNFELRDLPPITLDPLPDSD